MAWPAVQTGGGRPSGSHRGVAATNLTYAGAVTLHIMFRVRLTQTNSLRYRQSGNSDADVLLPALSGVICSFSRLDAYNPAPSLFTRGVLPPLSHGPSYRVFSISSSLLC